MESFKVLEWNINHRQGRSQKYMPEWVATVIRMDYADADIIILTECSSNVPNWDTIKSVYLKIRSIWFSRVSIIRGIRMML